MIITKENLLADIENSKTKISELVGIIKYSEQLIKYLEKEEPKKEEPKCPTTK